MKKSVILSTAVLLALMLCACSDDSLGNTAVTSPSVSGSSGTTGNASDPTEEHTHDYSAQQKSPTCTEDGKITYSCHCGDSYSETLYAIGHDFGDLIVSERPTMTQTGIGKRICSSCDEELEEVIPVNTLEQEVQSFLDDLTFGIPTFESTDKLSGGFVFDWLIWHIPKVSWVMDENYVVTVVYSIDDMDAFTQKYLGKTFDYTQMIESNKDYMSLDADKRQVKVITGGAGGGGYKYTIDSLTNHGDNTYTVRYLAVDPYVDDTSASASYYGTIDFKIVDGHMQLSAHTKVK